MERFTVLMSVYKNDKAEDLVGAVESVTLKQILRPSELILIVDGPVPKDLENSIIELSNNIGCINVIWLNKNGGLGNALRIGLENATNEIVARMDSDDVSDPSRFEKQIGYLKTHPDCSIVGGQISEFIGSEDNIVGHRLVPCESEDILRYLKKRCPFNHMTVAFRRSDVLKVGNYVDWHYNEDYYLWIRMAEAGFKFANLPDVLVNVRVGKSMYARRGGWKYFKSEKGLQDYMRDRGMILFPQYVFNVSIRFAVQVLLPSSVRGLIFKNLFRKK